MAATEFVLWLSVLVFPLLNAVDLSFYVFQTMQVESAAQAAVQMAWKQCDYTKASSPLVKTCLSDTSLSLLTKMQDAAGSMTLGKDAASGVTLANSDIKEGYFCANGSGSLVKTDGTAITATDWQTASSFSVPNTTTCQTSKSLSGKTAGDYVQATVHYTYTPIFPYASIVSLLPTAMTKTAILRLDGGS